MLSSIPLVHRLHLPPHTWQTVYTYTPVSDRPNVSLSLSYRCTVSLYTHPTYLLYQSTHIPLTYCITTHPTDTLYHYTHPTYLLYQSTHIPQTYCITTYPTDILYQSTHIPQTYCITTHPTDILYHYTYPTYLLYHYTSH